MAFYRTPYKARPSNCTSVNMTSKQTVVTGNSFRGALKVFCDSTSIHGIYYMARRKHRILWALLFCTVTLYCCNQCEENIATYLRYDVSTKVTDVDKYNFTFPAISFFNSHIPTKRSTFGNFYHVDNAMLLIYANTYWESSQIWCTVSVYCLTYWISKIMATCCWDI